MQAHKVTPIDGEQGTSGCNGEGQDVAIVDALVRLSRLKYGQDIVAKAAQCLNDLEREILVGIEPRQRSGRLLLTQRLLNRFWVGFYVEPGSDEIARP